MSTVKTKVGAKEWARKTSVAVQVALPLLDPDVQRSLENLATQIEAILDILPVGTGVDNTVPRFVGTSGLIEPTALVISDTSFLSGAAGVGIGGATADATNRLSVNAPAVLFNRETDDIQVKLNKEAVGDTASFLFQTAFSGRAEIGLVANDDFVFKTSPDGAAFNSGLTVLGADAGVRVHVNIAPSANDGAPLGLSGTAFSDLFLASGGVLNWNAGDVTVTHSANALAFAGASSGYSFDASLLLASGTVLNWNAGDVTITHAANTLAFAGAATAYTFADGPIRPAANDGVALGVSGTAFSDLFLASGGVINWNAGDVTITHAANTLAFAGAATAYTFADGPIRPAANDGVALGVSGTAFSDLFLASGGVLNWNAGDITLTHSASTTLTLNSIGQTALAITSVPTAGLGNCGIELGRVDGTGSTPFFDFHSGATAVDYDVRLIASGGTGVDGGGNLRVHANNFSPGTDGGTALGTTGQRWSDLFLASGGVINWNAGDVTITHSANLLTLAGGNFSIGTAGVLTAGTIELGAATDTTLARSSAGNISVEGNLIYRAGGTDVPVADGGTGRSSHTEYAVICGGTTTTAAQQSIAGVGSSGQVLTSNGAGALPTFQPAPGAGITVDTPQATTSGTAFDFTGLPTGINRITVIFDNISMSGTDDLLVQIGDSGGIETTGYLSASSNSLGTISTSTSGYVTRHGNATRTLFGHVVLTRITDNVWIASHTVAGDNTSIVNMGAGSKTLSAELDRIRLTRTGANTFDAGQVNIFYE